MGKEDPGPPPEAALTDDAGQPLPFESALEELETLVERMELGELSLEASLEAFERGVRLHAHCQQALEQAAEKVRVLSTPSGGDPADADLADLDTP